MVEREVEGPGKGWLSHDQISNIVGKIFLAIIFPNILENLSCQNRPLLGPLSTPCLSTKRPWERGCLCIIIRVFVFNN